MASPIFTIVSSVRAAITSFDLFLKKLNPR